METKVKTGISYFGNRNPRHFIKDLEEMVSHNCNFIVHTFSENDQQFYKGTMAELVSLSKDAGLKCYIDPWGVGRVFGGETYSSFALQNIDACQVLPDDRIAPAVCFNQPAFRDFMQKWIEDAVDIGADVIFWDEPHFYIHWKDTARYDPCYCKCNSCRDKFKNKYGKELTAAEKSEIVSFKEECVVEFLQELCDATKAKGVKNAICLLPFKDQAKGISDWSKVAAIPSVDIFGTDPYWMYFDEDINKFVGSFSRDVFTLCEEHNKEAQIWIQSYKIAAGREEELKEAIAAAYSEGIRNFAAWSYYGNAYMSYNRSDNPQKVWDVLGSVYGELQLGEWK